MLKSVRRLVLIFVCCVVFWLALMTCSGFSLFSSCFVLFFNSDWQCVLEIRTDDLFFRFGLTKCFADSDWRSVLQIRTDKVFYFFSDWRCVFKFRTDDVSDWQRFGLTKFRTEEASDWKGFGLMTFRTENLYPQFHHSLAFANPTDLGSGSVSYESVKIRVKIKVSGIILLD